MITCSQILLDAFNFLKFHFLWNVEFLFNVLRLLNSHILNLHCFESFRFLCIRDQNKVNNYSHISALTSATQPDLSTSQIEALCSGQFTSDNNVTNQKTSSFFNILKSNSLDRPTQDSASDVIGLCSGVFPTLSSRPAAQSVVTSSDSSDNEEKMPRINRRKRYTKTNPPKNK